MNKPQSLRKALNSAVQYVRDNPDRLHLFVDNGSLVATSAASVSWEYLIGTDENVLVLSRTYANRTNAERAAKMQWERLQRGVATFSIQLARGQAELYTEMPLKVSGFKQQVDAAEWIITTLTHSLGDSGFTTSLELEVKIDSLEME